MIVSKDLVSFESRLPVQFFDALDLLEQNTFERYPLAQSNKTFNIHQADSAGPLINLRVFRETLHFIVWSFYLQLSASGYPRTSTSLAVNLCPILLPIIDYFMIQPSQLHHRFYGFFPRINFWRHSYSVLCNLYFERISKPLLAAVQWSTSPVPIFNLNLVRIWLSTPSCFSDQEV